MYPNPTNGDISINVTGCKPGSNVSVLDMMGDKITEQIIQPGDRTIHFSLSNFVTGNYIVAIQNGTERIYKKLSVIR